MKVLITIVNYNTKELLSNLLFSLFRVLGSKPLRNCDILVIDNNSSDGSRTIIKAMRKAGLIRAILNTKQMYHAPALNQGLEIAKQEKYDIFWAIDSDVVILRQHAVRDALNSMQSRNIDMMSQYNNAGESHVSCMMLRVSTMEKLQATFLHGGNPSRYMERHCRRSGAKVRNFPFRSHYYILHVGCGTRKAIKDLGDTSNAWFEDIADCSPWYHGDPLAPAIHDNFKQLFMQEIPRITPRAIVKACTKKDIVQLQLPEESPGPDPKILSPTARGKKALEAKASSLPNS